MDKYKKANLRSPYLGIVGAMVLFALLLLLPSSQPYVLSFGVQYQPPPPQQQQSATIIVASSNQNMTTAPSASANGTTTTTISNETATTTLTMAGLPNATLVEFVSNIEQISGHLHQAVINKESGNNTLAEAHTLHPIAEVYSSIEDLLANQNSTLNQTLSAALQNLSSSVTNATVQEFESQEDSVNMLLNNSVRTLVLRSDLNDPAFNASVIARLLHVAGHEYEEAVENGTVKAIVEYQDAQAFIYRAESIFKSSASRIGLNIAQEVEEVNQFFSNLNGAVNNTDDPETVETTINGIIDELAEITGLSESQLIGEEAGAEE